jgi:hypothetical protein
VDLIRQLWRKYKYPPEGCEEAIALVLQQVEALADDLMGEGAVRAATGCPSHFEEDAIALVLKQAAVLAVDCAGPRRRRRLQLLTIWQFPTWTIVGDLHWLSLRSLLHT